jgi:uncharacterized phage protein (TIGR01671 family)
MKIEKLHRVWDGKKMWYDGSIQFDMMPSYNLNKTTFFEFEGIESGEIVVGNSVREFELMQWIGKTDINNKKVFEGDILKFITNSSNGFIYAQVIYNTNNCQFQLQNLKRWTYADKSFGYDKHEFCRIYDIEVIGNIYENSNLLIEHDDIKKLKKQ